MPDLIQPESLSWALTHVRKYGDTDIFPPLFEYEAIAHNWNSIGPYLQGIDFGQHRILADRRLMVIKPGGGFRAAMQLDPLDQLIYTAAIYESAELIERLRIPADQKIACSYRIKLSPDGAFFSAENGWRHFHERSRQLAECRRFSHVFLADISDFYNQLGQHRIQNALEMANVPPERSKNIERFLNQLTAKQSQGLPVGPFASIILAEACLIDVDNFIQRLKVPHVRYVDDFRIFCISRKEAIDIRHHLSDYLFAVHRLSLESSKSSVYDVEQFIAEELSDPEERERQARVDKLSELLNDLSELSGGYGFEPIEIEANEKLLGQAEKESFVALFEQCVEQKPLHLGLARYLLRKALRSRTVVLNDLVFGHLETLAPVMRDVVRYLTVTIPKGAAEERGRLLAIFSKENDLSNLPFIRMWMLELMVRRPDLSDPGEAVRYAEESTKDLGVRNAALLAAAYKQIDWVRGRKETWRNFEPWGRRALIWSAKILPSGERKPFLTMVAEQGDRLDAAVAKYVLSLG